MAERPVHADMPYRVLGRTGEQVSAIGLGGWHLGFKQVDEQLSLRIVRSAIDHGINFMDNCWDYNDGESERRSARQLEPVREAGRRPPERHDAVAEVLVERALLRRDDLAHAVEVLAEELHELVGREMARLHRAAYAVVSRGSTRCMPAR